MLRDMGATSRGSFRRRNGQRGQTVIFVVLALGIVFLAILGFAVDFGNLWFHRQAAQSAADAACTAAAMDMLYNVQAVGAGAKGAFPAANPFNCSANSTAAPCQYAALNGYSAPGLTANADSNEVQIAFLSSTDPGVPPIPVCPNPIPVGMTTCIPSSGLSALPFVRATVTDRMRTAFFGLVSSSKSMDIPAKATCGLVLQSAPIPLLILDPTRAATLTSNGGGGVRIYGGPQQSIQVNSSNVGALDWNGNKLQVDLSQGGPGTGTPPVPTGSDFGIFGVQSTTPSTTKVSTCAAPPGGPDICLGTTGNYISPKFPIADPFATITAPDVPTWTGNGTVTNGTVTSVAFNTHGCPAPSGTCDMYSPGYYPTGITVTNAYAIFQPGIYYIKQGIKFGSNSCVRPSTDTGDGSGGTFFYFADNNSILVSGGGCNTNPQTTASNFTTGSGAGAYTFGVACDSLSLSNKPTNLPTDISGSVLLAPCRAPTDPALCAPNCTINGSTGYGDPLGATDPAGEQRGLLFMQNRSANLAGPPSNQPSWQGGGAFLISGSIYFHRCTTGSTDTGVGCTAAAFNDQLSIGGNSSGTSYILGDVVVDQLSLNGTPNLYMDLSPNALYFVFRASLLQ